ncbi:hypothetical protein SDC9_208703 [bioreactor metagenome]|uniref:Uncharacterized protein n=1 Tax=bioreactor metagenome TaxID=1076179 RepID=A0A645JD26_9ZZZZ
MKQPMKSRNIFSMKRIIIGLLVIEKIRSFSESPTFSIVKIQEKEDDAPNMNSTIAVVTMVSTIILGKSFILMVL